MTNLSQSQSRSLHGLSVVTSVSEKWVMATWPHSHSSNAMFISG